MRILALDTCLAACSVAIWEDGAVLARDWTAMQRGHAEALLPMTENIRIRMDFSYGDFNRIAVTIGPGSFAGVRVGLSAARGICLAHNLPLVGINTLEVLAAAVPAQDRVGVALDVRNDQLYFQAFSKGAALCPPALLNLADAAALIRTLGGDLHLVGTAARALAALCDDSVCMGAEDILPDAAILAGLAAQHPAVAGDQVMPLYLRPPDAKQPAAAR